MRFNPEIHHRQSIRLRDYDYARAGAYFVTVCAFQRECAFGEVVDGQVVLNEMGEIVRDEWMKTANFRVYVQLDEFVIMPNHFHAVLWIKDVGATHRVAQVGNRHAEDQTKNRPNDNRATHRVAPTAGPVSGSIGAIIGQFKSAATKRINACRNTPGIPAWQRNYFERVIRDDRELENIRQIHRRQSGEMGRGRESPHPVQQRNGLTVDVGAQHAAPNRNEETEDDEPID